MEANIQRHQQNPQELITRLSQIDDLQLKELMDHVTRETLSRTVAKLEHQERKLADMQQELEFNRSKIAEMEAQQDAVINKNNYMNDTRYSQDYVNVTNLGRKIIPTISNFRMIELLKWAKILQVYQNIPYIDYVTGKEPMIKQVKGVANSGHEYLQYMYHADRTWRMIDARLKEAGLLTEFKTQPTTFDLHHFIDKYCSLRKHYAKKG